MRDPTAHAVVPHAGQLAACAATRIRGVALVQPRVSAGRGDGECTDRGQRAPTRARRLVRELREQRVHRGMAVLRRTAQPA
jgi:hypothetical protein